MPLFDQYVKFENPLLDEKLAHKNEDDWLYGPL
jgi:hypothetical protein